METLRKIVLGTTFSLLLLTSLILTQKYAFGTKPYPYKELTPANQSVGCFSPFKLKNLTVNTRTGQMTVIIDKNTANIQYDGLAQKLEIHVTQTNYNPDDLMKNEIQNITKEIQNNNGKSTTVIKLPHPKSEIYSLIITVKNQEEVAKLADITYSVPPSTCEIFLAPIK